MPPSSSPASSSGSSPPSTAHASATRAQGGGQLQGGDDFLAIFNLFDHNGDGAIVGDEVELALASLADMVSPDDAADLRQEVLTSGVLTAEQFCRWAQGRPGFDISRTLRQIFALIDTDGSGTLSGDEITAMLEAIDPGGDSDRMAALMGRYDSDGNGVLSFDEFVGMLQQDDRIAISLADLKRLKKTLVHYDSAARCSKIGLVEVDCDLGAGIPGAGSGIDLLKQAAQRQADLRRISDQLIEEIQREQRPQARADAGATDTPYARHIARIAEVMARTAELVEQTCTKGLFPVVLGGDHSTAAGTIAGLRRAHPQARIGVIWIDAHADIHSPFTTPSGNMHGMPLAVASLHDNRGESINELDEVTEGHWRFCQALARCDGPAIQLRDLIYIAVRDTEPAEDQTINTFGIPIVNTAQVRRLGPEAAAARCLSHLQDCDRIYVSFDVDSMDSTICKGTGTPVPGGLTAAEAVSINRTLLADPRVCCWEICEINPHLDTLNSLAEVSLGVYQGVLEVLEQRL